MRYALVAFLSLGLVFAAGWRVGDQRGYEAGFRKREESLSTIKSCEDCILRQSELIDELKKEKADCRDDLVINQDQIGTAIQSIFDRLAALEKDK